MKRGRMPEDTSILTNIKHGNTAKMPQLPPVAIDSMSQGQLRDFIPNLLRMVTGKSSDLMAKDSKPDWWPHDVPWSATKTDTKHQEASFTETLRNIVRSCYKHLGQENLLAGSGRPSTRSMYSYSGLGTSLNSKQRTNVLGKQNENYRHQYSEIFICFFCEKEFNNKDDMRNHQAKCDDRPPELQAVKTPPKQSKSPKGPPPMSPKYEPSDHFARPSKDVFIKLVNILPVQKAEKIRARKRTNSMDIDCEKLDLDDPRSPISPTTPRTPKSLISQLSRDDNISVSKKRLSYSEPLDNSDKESVASGCSEDTEEKPSQKGKSLLTIDISSLLGQRIQKHILAETNIEIVVDSETFCKTPKKNDFLEKLRNRTVCFPVTFKPRKKFQTKHFHKYKFTRKQREEFTERLNTGLNRNSRALRRNVPNCKVVLAHLTKRELKKWLSPYMYRKAIGAHLDNGKDDCVFPKDPVLLSKDLDRLLGLKRRSFDNSQKAVPPLQLANVVSEDVNAETSKQKLTLYRCLLTEVSGLGSSFNEKYNKKKLQQQKKELKASAEIKKTPQGKSTLRTALEQPPVENSSLLLAISPMSPYGKHAKSFLQNTPPDFAMMKKEQLQDDNISILSISSDEESFKSGCCSACKNKCHCTPEGSAQPSPHAPESSVQPSPQAPLAISPPLHGGPTISAKLNVPLNLEPLCILNLPGGSLSPPESEADLSQKLSLPKSASIKSESGDKVNKGDKPHTDIKLTPDKMLTRSKSSPEKSSMSSVLHRKGSVSTPTLKNKLEHDSMKKVQPSIRQFFSRDVISKLRSSPRKAESNSDVVAQTLKRKKSVSSPTVSPRKRANSSDILNSSKLGLEPCESFRRSTRIGSTSNSPYASPSKMRRTESDTG